MSGDSVEPLDISYTPSVRWAGGALVLAGAILLVTITLYGFVFGAPAATDPSVGVTTLDRAHHLDAHWGGLAATWAAEVVAFVLMAVAALTLVGRTGGGGRWLPRPAAWALVAVGGTLQAVMYAFMLGGYPPAVRAVGPTPALLEAMNGAAVFLFNASNAALSFGMIGVYAAEAREGVLMSKRAGWIGAALYVLAVLGAGATAARFGLVTATPFGLLGQALTIFVGARLMGFTGRR
ncbi:MAG: hypothetical protein ACN0LA_09765 [Candidatus Longimicrobiales bacterium M2_2A_002]